MKYQFFSLPLIILVALFLFTSCNKESLDKGGISTESFDALVESVGPPKDAINETSKTTEAEETEVRDDEIWRCTTTRVDQQQGAGGSSGYPLFSPNAGVIYPGNLLQGASLGKATPDIVGVARAGGDFSIDVIDGNLSSSFGVDEVSKSKVTTALNAIIADATGVVPANFYFDYQSIQSTQQLAASMRLKYETFATEVEGKLSFSSDREYNRYVVTLNQSFYTMSYDIPTSLEDVFAPSVTPKDLAKYTGIGNPLTYISEVTYGRTYYMLIESTSTEEEMSASISGSFNALAASGEGEADVDALTDLKNLRIKVFGYGGESGSTLETIGVTDLNLLSRLLARAGGITSGKPLSYVVRSLYDNQIVSTQLATSYDITNCRPVSPSSMPYTSHWTGQVLEKLGPVGAAYADSATQFILISEDGERFLKSRAGELEGPFPISEIGGGVECPLNGGIGAACNIEGNEWESKTILAIDKVGTQYSYWLGSRWTDPRPTTHFGSGNGAVYPLVGGGMGAICFAHKEELGPSSRYIFNKAGTHYTRFFNNRNGNGPFYSRAYSLWQWGPDNTCPFESISAAIGFTLNGKNFYIMFDANGEKYTVYGDLDGNGKNGFSGVFDL